MKYEYIILASNNDYFSQIYSNLQKYSNIHYISSPNLDNSVERFLYRLHFSSKINSKIKLPLKGIWNSKYKKQINTEKPLCFIYFSNKTRLVEAKLQKYLKQEYPNSKHVLYIQDLINHSLGRDYDSIKEDFDLILSYDLKEAKKYNIHYYPLVYSKALVKENPLIESSDIYFLGKAKDRLDKIITCYQIFEKKGYVCDFNVVGVPKEEQVLDSCINYIDEMSYQENLEHVLKTKYLLEILQSGAESATLRCNEALVYNKGLITNNKNIKKQEYYNFPRFQYFFENNDLKDIELKDFEKLSNNKYEENLDPINLIKRIEDLLENT